ncbi:MAG: lipopolysaccharide biosynthesis protein, partial [Pseudobdellovibrionaceae bacterium]
SVLFVFISIIIAGVFLWNQSENFFLAVVICLIAISKSIEVMIDLVYAVLQRNDRNDLISRSMIVRGLFNCVFFTLSLYLSRDLRWACFGVVISSLLCAQFYDRKQIRAFLKNEFRWSQVLNPVILKEVKALALLALPLGFVAVLGSLEVTLPRYFLEHSVGLASLGIFSALSYPLMLGNQFIGALATAPATKLALFVLQKNKSAFAKLVHQLLFIGAFIGGCMVLICFFFGTEILTFVNRAEYAAESASFSILAAAAALNYIAVFFGAGISALQAFRVKFILQLIGFGSLILFCLVASAEGTLFAMSLAVLGSAAISLLTQAIAFWGMLWTDSRLNR